MLRVSVHAESLASWPLLLHPVASPCLPQVITCNIYRNMHEAFQTFDYIAEQGNFGWVSREAGEGGGWWVWGVGGARSEEHGGRSEERGGRSKEGGGRREERGGRSEERGARREERGVRSEERGVRSEA